MTFLINDMWSAEQTRVDWEGGYTCVTVAGVLHLQVLLEYSAGGPKEQLLAIFTHYLLLAGCTSSPHTSTSSTSHTSSTGHTPPLTTPPTTLVIPLIARGSPSPTLSRGCVYSRSGWRLFAVVWAAEGGEEIKREIEDVDGCIHQQKGFRNVHHKVPLLEGEILQPAGVSGAYLQDGWHKYLCWWYGAIHCSTQDGSCYYNIFKLLRFDMQNT